MYRPLTIVSDEADSAFKQVEWLIHPSSNGNSPDLADSVPHQAMLSGPGLSDSSVTKSIPIRNVSNGDETGMDGVLVIPHIIHTHTDISNDRINEANLNSRGLHHSSLSPSEIDNQFDNAAAGLLPGLYERYLGESMPDETFTGSISNHAAAIFEEPIGLVDHALDPSIASSPAHALLAVGNLEPRTRMEIPEMLSRFLKVDRLNDSLRYEAGIAISEGRVQQGEDIVRRKILEEGWQWSLTPVSTTSMDLNTSWKLGSVNSLEKDCGIEGHCVEEYCVEDDCMEYDCMEDGCIEDDTWRAVNLVLSVKL